MSNDLDVAYVVDFFNPEDGSKSTHQIFWGRSDAEDYVAKFNGSNRPYNIRKSRCLEAAYKLVSK